MAETDLDPFVANVRHPQASCELGLARTRPGGSDLPTDSIGAERAADRLMASSDRAVVDFELFSVVMATHARTGVDRLAARSVTAQVVRHAPCPVLVTRIAD